MHEQDKVETGSPKYPVGRGYGHDLMRGGEVFGGYGYADRPEYEQRRGDVSATAPDAPLQPSRPHGGDPPPA
jgi:hypothetical protein